MRRFSLRARDRRIQLRSASSVRTHRNWPARDIVDAHDFARTRRCCAQAPTAKVTEDIEHALSGNIVRKLIAIAALIVEPAELSSADWTRFLNLWKPLQNPDAVLSIHRNRYRHIQAIALNVASGAAVIFPDQLNPALIVDLVSNSRLPRRLSSRSIPAVVVCRHNGERRRCNDPPYRSRHST